MAIKKVNYTLGLDIGIASVGAALLGEDCIISLFVRTFDKAETAKEGESLNKIRRDSRLIRRRLRRRAHRLVRMRRFFKRSGMPDYQPSILSPWQLRAEALERLLTPLEWEAVLYHLVKHRGFQSNRKSEAKEDSKVGEMLSGVKENNKLLEKYKTIGEMAWKDERFRENKRNKGGAYSHTFLRKDIVDELVCLSQKQRALGNKFASNEVEEFIRELLNARKPALSGDALLKMLGKCTFEKTEYRAAKASYTAERFVWMTKLNNLRIAGSGETFALDNNQRNILFELPFTTAKLTYKQVRMKLGLSENERFIGLDYNRKDNKDPESVVLFEAKAFHQIRKAYENKGLLSEWKRDSCNKDRLDDLGYALTVFKDDKESGKWLLERGVEKEIIEAVLEISFSSFIRLSIKALRKILPAMEEKGLRYDEAVQAAGYSHHSQIYTDAKSKYLPAIDKNDVSNPVVYRSLNQARKLLNAIVKEYGAPMGVNIELARNLTKPFDERNKIKKEQELFRDNKDKVRNEFTALFRHQPEGLDLVKWTLYRQQNAQCAYSQAPFDLNRLFESGYAEVDHCLPYSRSFDNSMNNKVLVFTKENRDKGNKTPYEYMNGATDSDKWQRFVAWVNGNKNYRIAKRQRLLKKDFKGDESEKFREKNLTDTRYACKKFKELVERHLKFAENSDNKRCVVVSGQLTAFLRTRWGLLKVRADGDTHHALDAAVIAACTHGMVKRLSDYSRRKELELVSGTFIDPETGEILDSTTLEQAEKDFPKPFDFFRSELEARLSPNPAVKLPQFPDILPIRVSRAVQRRGLGSAHQETIRSPKHLDEGISSVKTPLSKLSLKDLPKIIGYSDPRNKSLIDAIERRLLEHEDKGEEAFRETLQRPSASGKIAPIVRSVRLSDTQKSGLILESRGGGIANNGDILRTDIFTKGGKFFVIPLYVADSVRKILPNRAIVANKPEAEWTLIDDSYQFLFSLYKNDWIKVISKTKPAIEGYYGGVHRGTGTINIWSHDHNKSIGKDGCIEGVGIKTALSLEKYNVDMLGRLYIVKNETRQPLKRR